MNLKSKTVLYFIIH